MLFAPTITLFGPMIGVEAAKIGLILVLINAIVAFAGSFPVVFNSYAFMFMTVSGVALGEPNANPYLWMAMTAVGGAVLIVAVIGINKIMGAPPESPLAE